MCCLLRLSRYSALFIFALLGACASNTSATSEFEPMKWKTFESRLLGKKVTFEFPVDIRGTSEFEFNPGMPPPMFQGDPRDELRIIYMQTGQEIGWVHIMSNLTLNLSALSYRANPPSTRGEPVYIGQNVWQKSVVSTNKSVTDVYSLKFTNDYKLLFTVSSKGSPGSEQHESAGKIAQHILESIKIE